VSNPHLSVIVASHNRGDLLLRCLRSLAEQTAAADSFEVIVADDGSEDDTATLAEGFESPYPLRVLRLPKSGHAAAQNAALEQARAPRCLLLDDDMIASPELVEAHIAAEDASPPAIGVGAITQHQVADETWFAETYARGWAAHYADLAEREARWNDCYGANLSFPTEVARGIGWVSTDMPQAKDFDLALRLIRAGCKPLFLPRAHAVHDDRMKGSAKIMSSVRRAGKMHLELSRRFPEFAPELLNWKGIAGPKLLAARRLALTLRLPPARLIRLGRFLPGPDRKMIWFHFCGRLSFWSGVREEVGNETWRALTDGRVEEALAAGLR
jgi:glycosyltransferase involved in cell wall biosynthesis